MNVAEPRDDERMQSVVACFEGALTAQDDDDRSPLRSQPHKGTERQGASRSPSPLLPLSPAPSLSPCSAYDFIASIIFSITANFAVRSPISDVSQGRPILVRQ